MPRRRTRPIGIVALTSLFLIGTAASLISVVSLSLPGSFLEAVWRLNPQARESFSRMGSWAILLMSVICLACLFAAIGLGRGLRWGYWLALVLLIGNLVGDIIVLYTGAQPRAIAGVPIVLLVLAYLLSRRTREYFRTSGEDETD
jgi:hypothetical protein